MTRLNKWIPLAITSCFITAAAFAVQNPPQSEDYSIVLMKNCQIVSKHAMNKVQINSYLALKKEEVKMKGLEQPIKGIEQQLAEYSQQIETLSASAYKENNDSIHIDKHLAKQQKAVVEKLNVLMANHQKDFDVLGEQGDIIGIKASHFSQTLKDSIGDVVYDYIRIISPENQSDNDRCDSGTYRL